MSVPAQRTPIPPALGMRPDLMLCRVSGAIGRLTAEALAPLEINAGHHSVLRMLADGGPVSQQLLGAGLRIDRTTMVGLTDLLEARGLVARRRNDTDRRAYVVSVTPAGRRLLARADRRIEAFLGELFAPLPDAHRRAFVGALASLVDAGGLPGFETTSPDDA